MRKAAPEIHVAVGLDSPPRQPPPPPPRPPPAPPPPPPNTRLTDATRPAALAADGLEKLQLRQATSRRC